MKKMALPHDYYLKFTDSTVLSEVLDFHNKGNYTLHEAFQNISYLHALSATDLETLTGKEIRLYPDMHLSAPLNCTSTVHPSLIRHGSCEEFSHTETPFSTIENLFQPLLGRLKDSHKRGYPSGGALYPIETFVCSLNEESNSWPFTEKALHLLPHSRAFEIVQNASSCKTLKESMLSSPSAIGSPNIAIVYIAYLPKTLCKYRYRGYRLALMEAGSIYMLIELQAKSLGLRCRLWSGFNDTMLCKALGLNPAIFSPLCIHFIGQQA